ncbi:MAG TPA: V-type ATP synthase subunit D [candidate division WOR-3 bacterium]|uniref:V-type ATP synthase subunit D n=1 Tax=candidate division WOR-3 bacterium TaxID=2052148 RepID=A0A9C9EL92_UNCW3|nr:V-type ATP synthase subunit D [candidate division WOR-3 bacterium]
MKLDIPPTRMQLLRLKRRGVIARRGHKLLKDKQDELMRRILEMVNKIRESRLKIEEELRRAFGYFYFASSKQAPKATDEALLSTTKLIDIEYTTERILNLKIPKFSKKISGGLIGYGFMTTSGDLDLALLKVDRLISRLLELAELEKALELLADEIEKTRRRVNALEYILIPSIDETIKFINLKLSEMERGDLTRLMRVKEIVRGK